ncbi:MAG: BlaI/MecI/CopY family transcriptional regulator [Sedimentisphaerales bacterium]|nr:BlaI/MecI/CopY family transcriptional regulator [Sedimentisphaerales bacterium]
MSGLTKREVGTMSRKPLDHFGQLQRAVIEVVWELGEATVRQVWKRLCHKKDLAYTTVLTAMQRLEKNGWLRHRVDGRKHIYLPTRTREQAGAGSVRKFVQRMFDGNALLLFRQLVEEGELSDKELRELQKLINQKRKEREK